MVSYYGQVLRIVFAGMCNLFLYFARLLPFGTPCTPGKSNHHSRNVHTAFPPRRAWCKNADDKRRSRSRRLRRGLLNLPTVRSAVSTRRQLRSDIGKFLSSPPLVTI